MRVRWENIFALIFLVLLIYFIAGGGTHLRALIAETMSPASWGPHNRVAGLMALGFILISIVAIVKIIVSRPR